MHERVKGLVFNVTLTYKHIKNNYIMWFLFQHTFLKYNIIHSKFTKHQCFLFFFLACKNASLYIFFPFLSCFSLLDFLAYARMVSYFFPIIAKQRPYETSGDDCFLKGLSTSTISYVSLALSFSSIWETIVKISINANVDLTFTH